MSIVPESYTDVSQKVDSTVKVVTGTNLPTLGKKATHTALSALFSHHKLKVTESLKAALSGAYDYFLWTGTFPKSRGRFFKPAVFRATNLEAIIADLIADRTKPWVLTREEALDAIECNSGMTAERVAFVVAAGVEIDHLPMDEQDRKQRALAAATGLRWTVRTSSGGKSIHAFLAFTRLLAPHDPLRKEIQRLLIAILEGDTKIQDAGRMLRLPGWCETDRRQAVVEINADARYDPTDIHARLTAYAATLGITDVDRTFDAIRLAERICTDAARCDTESAVEMRAHADVLRATRGNPDAAAMRTGRNMLIHPEVRSCGGPTSGSAFARTRASGCDVLELPADRLEEYRALPRGARDFPSPCCGRRRAAIISHESGQSPRLYCFRCQHLVVAHGTMRLNRAPVLSAAEVAALDVLLDSILTEEEQAARKEAAAVAAEEKRLDALYEEECREDYFSQHLAKVEARRLKAETMDPAIVAATRRQVAFALGSGKARDLRRDLHQAGGIGWKPCGKTIRADDVRTWAMGGFWHGCGGTSCYVCGPVSIALQWGAVCHGPVVADGRIIGRPLADRGVAYRYEVAPGPADEALRRRLNRASVANVPDSYNRVSLILYESGTFAEEPPVWFRFDTGRTVVFLASVNLPPSRKGGGGTPVAAISGEEAICDEAWRLITTTYRVELEPIGLDLLDFDGNVMKKPVVVGRVSGCRGVSLDPDRIKRDSQEHAWVKAGDIDSVAALREAIKTHGVGIVHERTDDHEGAPDGELRSVISEPVPSPGLRELILEASGPKLAGRSCEDGEMPMRIPTGHAPVRRPKGWRPACPQPRVPSMDEIDAGVERILRGEDEEAPAPKTAIANTDDEDEKASDHRARAVARWACGYDDGDSEGGDDEESA